MFAAGDSEIFKPVAWRNLDVLMNPKNKLTAFPWVKFTRSRQCAKFQAHHRPSGAGARKLSRCACNSLGVQYPDPTATTHWRQRHGLFGAQTLHYSECACGYSCTRAHVSELLLPRL